MMLTAMNTLTMWVRGADDSGPFPPRVLEAVSKTMVDGLSFGAATELEVSNAELITELVPSVKWSEW